MFEKIKEMIQGKKVMLCTHWDADGVTSGALMYHLIREYVKEVNTISKGKPFLIEKSDLMEGTEVLICTDIQPSEEILDSDVKVIYIDHHPFDLLDKVDLAVYDPEIQSASLLIYEKIIPETRNPYFIFLTLLGYFGDQGDREAIPAELQVKANEFMPELMIKRNSYYSDGYYLDIERYVSLMNVGKRRNWNGDIPLELLKSSDHYEPIVKNYHPLMPTLNGYKRELSGEYKQDVSIEDLGVVHCIRIENDKNIQGVLAARHIKDKPLMVLNYFNEEVIGSMRVPDDLDFDAGSFLNVFNDKIESFLGGGHEKAAGFTLDKGDLTVFLELVENWNN